MKFLIDKSPKHVERKAKSDLVGGQLLTPLTRYDNWGGPFAIDNGAFAGFRGDAFSRLLEREQDNKSNCLFVAMPDIVGSGRRTLELWQRRERWGDGWPMALVAQDGMEDLDVPWDEMACLFVGGRDPWKDSQAAKDLVKTAVTLDVHCHVGRVNTAKRYEAFAELGADTCDGSGVAMYDHMLEALEKRINGYDPQRRFDLSGMDAAPDFQVNGDRMSALAD